MGVKIQRPGDLGHPGGNRRVYVRVNHQRRRKTRVFNSSKAAEAYALNIEAKLKLGWVEAGGLFAKSEPKSEPAPAVTVEDTFERWQSLDLTALKAGTRDSYVNTARLYVLKAFGSRPITSITRVEIEDWWVDLRRGKLSHSRLAGIRGVLAGIFRRATISGVLSQNPAEVIQGRMGREDRATHQAEWLTEEELTELLALAERREPRYYPILLTLVSTGIRLGECLGLQARDVDLEHGLLAVRRSLRKYRESSPKNGKGRTVYLPQATVEVLRAWLDINRAEAAVRGEASHWLFPSQTGRSQDGCHVRDAFRRILKAVGITRHMRLHDLRHTYASLAIQRGVNILLVSRQLGHGSVAITDAVYGHLKPEATREVATAWQGILGRVRRNPDATLANIPT
jgi:integrase